MRTTTLERDQNARVQGAKGVNRGLSTRFLELLGYSKAVDKQCMKLQDQTISQALESERLKKVLYTLYEGKAP